MKKEGKIRIWGRVFFIPVWAKRLFFLVAAAGAVLIGLWIRGARRDRVSVITIPSSSPSPVTSATASAASATPASAAASAEPEIWVYVVGEVRAPGVYRLPAGALVHEAVEAAGGFTEEGDREAVNLVSVLQANTMIRVPARSENASGESWLVSGEKDGGTDAAAQPAAPVNINTAAKEALCTLSGIGESTAQRIIDYREANGPFSAIEDIMKVPGIKEARFAAIKDSICV